MVGLWTVVFSFGLAVVGVVLALQQARSFAMRLMTEAEAQAARIASDARDRFDHQLLTAMHQVAVVAGSPNGTAKPALESLPGWIGLVHLWDGEGLIPIRAEFEITPTLRELIQRRLQARSAPPAEEDTAEKVDLLYDTLENAPLVLAVADRVASPDQRVTVVAQIVLSRLRAELLDPLIPPGSGLEVVPVSGTTGPWAQTLTGGLRFWAIKPTDRFVKEQQSAAVRQTMVYATMTLLALLTLLATMWFLARVARREMVLAELKANFVADVSHELKTPLALISMFAETLQSGRVTSEDKRQEYYGIMLRESTRLTNLINNILDFARIDAGKKEYRFEPIDVGQVVRETYHAYKAQLDAGGVEHHLSIDGTLPAVRADRDAIAQAVLNLISNAVKYSTDEKYVAIDVTKDTRRGRHGVLISIHDRGIGIRPEDRAHLTEGFFRSADNRVRSRGGTGLGLALVKHIVEDHHGSLDMESRLVKGSTFRIFLPADNREPVRAAGFGPRDVKSAQPGDRAS